MTALLLTVLTASLFGSLHCAGMCGAFLLFAIGAQPGVQCGRIMMAYHLGRLATYTLLGAAAGLLGSALDLGGKLVGIERTAAIGAGALMVGFGLVALARALGVKLRHLPLPHLLETVVGASHRRMTHYTPLLRALATGLLTTLLPCGWLYAFVITAAGTGNAATGALVMATFWIGTLPALSAIGLGVQKLSAPFARRLPFVTASAIVAVGIYTVAARAHITIRPHEVAHASPDSLAKQVRAIDQYTLPCCTTRPE